MTSWASWRGAQTLLQTLRIKKSWFFSFFFSLHLLLHHAGSMWLLEVTSWPSLYTQLVLWQHLVRMQSHIWADWEGTRAEHTKKRQYITHAGHNTLANQKPELQRRAQQQQKPNTRGGQLQVDSSDWKVENATILVVPVFLSSTALEVKLDKQMLHSEARHHRKRTPTCLTVSVSLCLSTPRLAEVYPRRLVPVWTSHQFIAGSHRHK